MSASTTATNFVALPELTTHQVQHQLAENAKLLDDWTKLLDRNGNNSDGLINIILMVKLCCRFNLEIMRPETIANDDVVRHTVLVR